MCTGPVGPVRLALELGELQCIITCAILWCCCDRLVFYYSAVSVLFPSVTFYRYSVSGL